MSSNADQTSRRQSLIRLAVFTSLLVPIACIPYIPIRRHLLNLKKSINVLSNNVISLQHELNNISLQSRSLSDEKSRLAHQFRGLQDQLDAVKHRASKLDSGMVLHDMRMRDRLNAIEEVSVQQEDYRRRVEKELKGQVDLLKKRIDDSRLPDELLRDISVSLADIASFIEEVEIQQGWLQSIPKDRGIGRMRQLALKLYSITQETRLDDRGHL